MKAVQQPRALATREKILKAAARLFALKGYHDTKLDEVRQVAEVTTGAFFHHFWQQRGSGLCCAGPAHGEASPGVGTN
jgi:Bacterial regulatory proteins, tetR family